jgi:hypothetical protein
MRNIFQSQIFILKLRTLNTYTYYDSLLNSNNSFSSLIYSIIPKMLLPISPKSYKIWLKQNKSQYRFHYNCFISVWDYIAGKNQPYMWEISLTLNRNLHNSCLQLRYQCHQQREIMCIWYKEKSSYKWSQGTLFFSEPQFEKNFEFYYKIVLEICFYSR